jgi:hypothetical protein
MSKIRIAPIKLEDANAFISLHHRHHKAAQGHRFSICGIIENRICGVAIIGRPVARAINYMRVCEVTRLCTDGTPNACSFLYGAAARIVKEMGYEKIQTYTLESESGVSLRASGWTMIAITTGGQWTHTKGKPRRTDQPTDPKCRYEKQLNPELPIRISFNLENSTDDQMLLF